jgi:hypothetical protein
VHRLAFLDRLQRQRAIDIEARIRRQFEARLQALQQRIAEFEAGSSTDRDPSGLMKERDELMAERDKALASELQRAGVTLSENEVLDLRPQSLRLRAGVTARGNDRQAWILRAREVNQLLSQEPPRRTVTGSFRPH